MSVFVNELAPPNVRSRQGQCVQQCQRIMKQTLHFNHVLANPPEHLMNKNEKKKYRRAINITLLQKVRGVFLLVQDLFPS